MPEPILLSTWSFGQRGNSAAWPALQAGGTALDAVEAVCRVVEADPIVDSVGLGGLPDREGRMSLDGCIMLAPDRFGAICAARRTLHVVSCARRLMEQHQRQTLAGDGADAFAELVGLRHDDLLSPRAKEKWQAWQRDKKTPDWSQDSGLAAESPNDNSSDPSCSIHSHDTVGALCLDSSGTLAGACSSSGLAYKIPGRIGDSPIIGHGLYVQPGVGAAVATGDGELITGVCATFLAVEELRRGASATQALELVLRRIADSYDLAPTTQVGLIVLAASGCWSSGCLRSGYRTAVADHAGSRVVEPDYIHLPETEMTGRTHGHEVR